MHLTRLLHNIRGSAAVEFAIVAPVVLLLYFGMAEVTQGLLANRRAYHVANAVGDLVAQSPQLKKADVSDIFNISTSLLAPLPTSTLSIRATSISFDANEVATVQWSETRGRLTKLSGALNDVPSAFVAADEGLVRVDAEYVYESPLKKIIPNGVTLSHTVYLKPRKLTAVQLIN